MLAPAHGHGRLARQQRAQILESDLRRRRREDDRAEPDPYQPARPPLLRYCTHHAERYPQRCCHVPFGRMATMRQVFLLSG